VATVRHTLHCPATRQVVLRYAWLIIIHYDVCQYSDVLQASWQLQCMDRSICTVDIRYLTIRSIPTRSGQGREYIDQEPKTLVHNIIKTRTRITQLYLKQWNIGYRLIKSINKISYKSCPSKLPLKHIALQRWITIDILLYRNYNVTNRVSAINMLI